MGGGRNDATPTVFSAIMNPYIAMDSSNSKKNIQIEKGDELGRRSSHVFHLLSYGQLCVWWAFGESNPGPSRYEQEALTNWAKRPYGAVEWTRTITPYGYWRFSRPLPYQLGLQQHMELPTGIEPATHGLQIRCSTYWAMMAKWGKMELHHPNPKALDLQSSPLLSTEYFPMCDSRLDCHTANPYSVS